VDIWAAGIIMYILLAGYHPLYIPTDTPESFTEKVKNPQFIFPPSFSEYFSCCYE